MVYITKRRISPTSYKKDTDARRNKKWDRFYQNKTYKKIRDYYMRLHPLCELCLFNGRSVPAEHCHHRVPFGSGSTDEEKMKLLLSPDNLQALCRDCHEKIHAELNHSS